MKRRVSQIGHSLLTRKRHELQPRRERTDKLGAGSDFYSGAHAVAQGSDLRMNVTGSRQAGESTLTPREAT